MQIGSELSQRLTVLKLLLIIGVLFIHAPKGTYAFADSNINLIQGVMFEFFAGTAIKVSQAAVPLFFLISGFFLFQKPLCKTDCFFHELKKRIRTLLIPFLFWNGLYLAIAFVASRTPTLASLFSGGAFTVGSDWSGFEYLSALVGIGRHPICYQFWFIRDLMLFVIVSPLIKLGIQKLPNTFILLLLVSSATGIIHNGLFFFALGGWLCHTDIKINSSEKSWTGLGISSLAILSLSSLKLLPLFSWGTIFLGMAVFWWFSGLLCGQLKIKQSALSLANYTFFIFAFHEPLLSLIGKVLYRVIRPSSDGAVLAMFYGSVCLCICLSIGAGKIFERLATRLYAVATGSR